MGGYGTEERLTKPIQGIMNQSGSYLYNRASQSYERTTSYRTSPRGSFVPDFVADPYAGFISRTNDRKVELALGDKLYGSENFESFMDTGHPFLTEKWSSSSSMQGHNYSWNTAGARTGGPLCVVGATPANSLRVLPFQFRSQGAGSLPTSGSISRVFSDAIYDVPDSRLTAFGGRAIALTAPGRAEVNLFSVVGELIAGVPKLIGHSLLKPGNSAHNILSDEFLNYIFGIQPTVKDMLSIVNVLSNISDRMLQLQRDAGRLVRRSYRLPVSSDSLHLPPSEVVNGSIRGGIANGYNYQGQSGGGHTASTYWNGGLQTTLDFVRQDDLWFKGAFTYFIPVTNGFGARVSKYQALRDGVITAFPDLQASWQLVPWSWLVDWFLDVKTNLSLARVSNSDSLVMNYGYAMRRTECTAVATATVHASAPIQNGVRYVRSAARYSRKQRIRANPYGFIGPSSSDFTPMRWAILAALGFSRL
jgi:hypothetical protein